MKVSIAWIKECLRRTMLNDQQIVSALEQAGIEIEQIISSKEIDERVVIALVKKVVQHPKADRLKLVEVGVGEETYRVVCGAPNVRPGLKVALAQIGTVLPGGDTITEVKLRGEVSEGMLCSEFELGIGLDHDGIMELSSDSTVGTSLCDLYPADVVVDIKTPANRFDLQSVVGIAREVAAITGAKLAPPTPPAVAMAKGSSLGEMNQVQRYELAHLKLRVPAPSPSMIARLQAVGVRSVSPVVDVTNYVMLETGQPLHAFDAARVSLPIGVRHARAGETLTTLDGVSRTLTPLDLVIADRSGPIALAGLMGGKDSEVSSKTKEILLESAVFEGATVRKMAQRHGLRTEASARFERGISPALPPLGMARAVELLKEVAGAQLVKAEEAYALNEKPRSGELSARRTAEILGFGISSKEIISTLARLQIPAQTVNHSTSDTMVQISEIPWWRPDLKEAEDFMEEVVRVIGYDHVPATVPVWRPTRLKFDRRRTVVRTVRDLAWAAGAFEVMTYSFISAKQLADENLEFERHLKLKNPLSSEQAYLRSTLLPSHLTVLERNRTYAKQVCFSEISKVFIKTKPGELPLEPLMFGFTVLETAKAYFSVKGLLDAIAEALQLRLEIVASDGSATYAPGRHGEIRLAGRRVGEIGQIHPRRLRQLKLAGEASHFEIDLDQVIAAAGVKQHKPLSNFPSISRDLTLLVDQKVTWQMVREATSAWDVSFVRDYAGDELEPGTKSLTIRVRLSLPDRTPTENQAAELERQVLARLRRVIDARVRNQ